VTIGPDFDDILGAAQAGAEWAFSLLYRDLNPPLLRYLAARAPSVAEDVAAETWIAVARQLGLFTGGEGAFRGWLFTIGRRRLIQHWREVGRRPATSVDAETLVNRGAPDDTAATAVAAVSAREAAAAIAAELPPDQADVVLLRILAGLDVDQVAEILGKRPGTVRVLQHKALRRLAGKFSVEALTP
jgi:RNA polymerase sigma-70 factor (ECF subfamily)